LIIIIKVASIIKHLQLFTPRFAGLIHIHLSWTTVIEAAGFWGIVSRKDLRASRAIDKIMWNREYELELQARGI